MKKCAMKSKLYRLKLDSPFCVIEQSGHNSDSLHRNRLLID